MRVVEGKKLHWNTFAVHKGNGSVGPDVNCDTASRIWHEVNFLWVEDGRQARKALE